MSILIYGHIDDEEIVFLPKGDAEYWAEFDKDLSTGITYGVLYEKYPDVFERLIENLCCSLYLQIDIPGAHHLSAKEYFDALFYNIYENYWNDESWIELAEDDYDLESESDARRFYENELSEDERLPLIDEIFSNNSVDFITLCEVVAGPRLMESWIPPEIEERFARKIDYGKNMAASVTSGEGVRMEYNIKNEKELIKAFEGHGYKCVRDDELIQNACG